MYGGLAGLSRVKWGNVSKAVHRGIIKPAILYARRNPTQLYNLGMGAASAYYGQPYSTAYYGAQYLRGRRGTIRYHRRRSYLGTNWARGRQWQGYRGSYRRRRPQWRRPRTYTYRGRRYVQRGGSQGVFISQ